MKNRSIQALATLLLVLPLASCMHLNHQVGSGAAGSTETSARQWYILWGLVPLNSVESEELAGGAANYTVESEQGIVDILLNIVTSIVTINSQTVTVTK